MKGLKANGASVVRWPGILGRHLLVRHEGPQGQWWQVIEESVALRQPRTIATAATLTSAIQAAREASGITKPRRRARGP